MTPHFYLPTLAVLRHVARRNVSFHVQALGSIGVRQRPKGDVATPFSKAHPIYTWLIGCASVKKNLLSSNGRQEYEML